MTRVFFLSFVAALAAACGGGGGDKTFESLCTSQVPPPACQTTCDPAPGSATSCPGGFHCASGGKCDTLCTVGGTECGSGFTCTKDGFCVDSGTGTGGPDGGGSTDPDASCPDLHFTASKVIPSIQLLIDRSGSMAENFTGGKADMTHPSKFATEVDALVGTSGIVTKLETSVYFGASMYPGSDPNTCQPLFAVPRALGNKANIAALLNANNPSNGNTPTPDAVNAVVQDFSTNKPPTGSPPVIVLATDGLPNTCKSNSTDTKPQSVSAVKAAFTAGIKVYVLSVGTVAGGDAHFQDLANAGLGVTSGAKVFSGASPADLASAFNEIIRGVVSCDLTLNGMVNSDDAASGTVKLNDQELTFMTDWSLDDTGTVIHLLGNACTTLKNSANPQVDASFPCGGGIIF